MLKKILVPDIGAFADVNVIEILVAAGDKIGVDAALISLETDKATMEIPSPFAGVIKSIDVKVGDKVSEGALILTLEVEDAGGATLENPEKDSAKASEKDKENKETKEGKGSDQGNKPVNEIKASNEVKPVNTSTVNLSKEPMTINQGQVHAGPGVRRFARELGVDLSRVSGSGPKNRLLKIDVQAYVKKELAKTQSGMGSVGSSGGGLGGLSVAPWPVLDHAKFGSTQTVELPRIKKLSGAFLHRNWVLVPHVTQFDEADITELERFRKENQTLAEHQGIKLTPLVFIMKAVVAALKQFPNFNASLDASGSQLILKNYFHIGVAVDTPNGLVVPVVRDVDQKGVFHLAKELSEISQKARQGQLSAADMQGSSFSISSLGGIGGTAFTPIINVPDVAILGVSKSQMKPIYIEKEFQPRLMLPLSLSYDHRVIDGAEAARFTTFLVAQLSDIRRLLF